MQQLLCPLKSEIHVNKIVLTLWILRVWDKNPLPHFLRDCFTYLCPNNKYQQEKQQHNSGYWRKLNPFLNVLPASEMPAQKNAFSVSLILIAWIKEPLLSQIKLCQGACAVAGKNLFLPPSWAENPLFWHWEKRQISDQTAASPAPSPSWAAQQCIPVSVWAPGPCLPWAQPLPLLAFPFFLSLPGTASDWKINRAATIQRGKFLKHVFSLYDWQCFQEQLLWWQSFAILNVLHSPFLENKSPAVTTHITFKKNNPTRIFLSNYCRWQKGTKKQHFPLCLSCLLFIFNIQQGAGYTSRFNFQSPPHIPKGIQPATELASCLKATRAE